MSDAIAARPALTVSLTETPEDVAEVQRLVGGFAGFIADRLAPIRHIVDRYYPPEAWEALLADLPRIHARPRGGMLLARLNGAAVGCVMWRPLEAEGDVELKRMFVDPAARGAGAARALLRAACAQTKADGHRRMLFDTSILQKEAQALYDSEGCVRRGPYYDAPEDVKSILIYFEKTL